MHDQEMLMLMQMHDQEMLTHWAGLMLECSVCLLLCPNALAAVQAPVSLLLVAGKCGSSST